MESTRRAAAVVLTRGQGTELEVYVVARSPALRFYGGYWAFPGGVVDPPLDADGADPSDEDVQAACALRELFEETGVLVGAADAGLLAAERAGLRRALVSEPAERVARRWSALRERAVVEPRLAPAFARVLTPPFSLRRYDTTFHHVRLPAGEVPVVDGEEAVDGAFVRPAELLARWRAGDVFVVPPTLAVLEHLAAHGLEAGLAAAGRSSSAIAAGRLSGACQSPGILVAPLRTPTLPPATTTNTLLVGGERTWIVDPATPHADEQRRLVGLCEEVLAEGRSLAGILLTHHHHDHVGAVAPLAEHFGLCVHAHPETLRRLTLPPTVRTATLHGGERLELGTSPGGRSPWWLDVLFTPGHAPGHLAFVESHLRGAIVGDLVSTLSTIVIDPPEGHMATYLASLERLVAAGVRVLHPAHGMPVRDGVDVVRALLAHRAAREAKLLRALAPLPRTTAELVREVYHDTPRELLGLAERSLLAGLEKLAEEGRATAVADGWRVA